MRTLLFLLLITISCSASAVTMKQYLEGIKHNANESVHPYENGLEEMLMAFNAQLKQQKLPQLFCLPGQGLMDRKILRELIIKAYSVNNLKDELADTTPPSYFLLPVLAAAYPCN